VWWRGLSTYLLVRGHSAAGTTLGTQKRSMSAGLCDLSCSSSSVERLLGGYVFPCVLVQIGTPASGQLLFALGFMLNHNDLRSGRTVSGVV
jgi:hypothetical protein